MIGKEVNAYVAMLLITVVGAGASWLIISFAQSAENLSLTSVVINEIDR